MRKLNSIITLIAIVVLSSCTSNQQKTFSEEEKTTFQLLGDSITTKMQNVLLQNVAGAIQKGGTDYAVEFCNLVLYLEFP